MKQFWEGNEAEFVKESSFNYKDYFKYESPDTKKDIKLDIKKDTKKKS